MGVRVKSAVLTHSFFFFFYHRMQRCMLNMYAESFLLIEFWMQHSRFYGSNVASCLRLFHTSYRAGDSAVASCQDRSPFLHICMSHCVGTRMGAWHAQHRVLNEADQFKTFFFWKSFDNLKMNFIPIVSLPQDKIWSITIVCLTWETFFVRSHISP